MSLVTMRQRVYLGAVAALALWVGVWCFFVPRGSAAAIPWLVAPLCAAFLGAMYLSGAVFCGASMLAGRWSAVRAVMPAIALWTGGLALISLFFLPAFNFAKPQVWIWFGAYIVYPAMALGLLWAKRAERHAYPVGEPAIPTWARRYLGVQGAVMMALGLALLAAPGAMAPAWPWQTGQMMLQLYSAPLLTYGLGSLSFTRQHVWSEIRIGVAAMGVFTGFGLIGSLAHADLLNGPALAVALWLGWLAVTTAALAGLSWAAHRAYRTPPLSVARPAAPVTP